MEDWRRRSRLTRDHPDSRQEGASPWAECSTIRTRRPAGCVGRFSAGSCRWGGPEAGFDPGALGLENCGFVSALRIERIDPGRDDRSDFGCGDPAVDGWLRLDEVAPERQVGVVQVATDGGRVVGCYRLGSFQVQARRPLRLLRSRRVERLPVSAVVVSRLGVDRRWQRQGVGTWLMWHALERADAVAPAVRARLVVAHGETERAPGFIARFGFRAFDVDPRWSYLPMRDLQATVSAPAAPSHSGTGMGSTCTRSLSPTLRTRDGGVGRGPLAPRS